MTVTTRLPVVIKETINLIEGLFRRIEVNTVKRGQRRLSKKLKVTITG